MKITQSQLRKIIQEEILKEGYAPVVPADIMNNIKKIADEALMNKSFGFDPEVSARYFQDIDKLIKLSRVGYAPAGGGIRGLGYPGTDPEGE